MIRPRLLAVLLLALIAGSAGCSDDDSPTGPAGFAVRVEVVDNLGRPVEGLELGLAPYLPEYYQDAPRARAQNVLRPPSPSPFFPTTAISIALDQAAAVDVTVEDIEMTPIRDLFSGNREAGPFRLVWDAKDDAERRVASGVYWVHLVLRETAGGPVVFEDRQPMLFAALYPDQYLVGTTDAAGHIVLRDERLFPYLIDGHPDLPAVDETGTQVGVIVLDPAMYFTVRDPQSGQEMSFARDVTGPGTVQLVFEPVN